MEYTGLTIEKKIIHGVSSLLTQRVNELLGEMEYPAPKNIYYVP